MGNLGDQQSFLVTLSPYKTKQNLRMYCDTGVIGTITAIGYAKDNSGSNGKASYEADSYCDLLEAVASKEG